MKRINYFYIVSLLVLGSICQAAPVTGGKAAAGASQTASYLSTLGKNPTEAYAKMKKVLTAPPVDQQTGKAKMDKANLEVNPQEFDAVVKQVIESERQHPGYFALYQGSAKEGFLTHLLRTYIHQFEHGWTRDDYFILRSLDAYYKDKAISAADYIKQNEPYILQQFIPEQGSQDPNCLAAGTAGCKQFDFVDFPVQNRGNWREHLVSASPSFIAGVDDTPQELRELYDEDRTAWESAFYYFATGLSWKTVRRLYAIMVSDIKKNSPALFANNDPINVQIRKYIAIKFAGITDILFPHDEQRKAESFKGSSFDIHSKAGMMFQILIPENVIDNVAYLAWQNGPVWQRKIGKLEDGWDNSIGAYTKLSPILRTMQNSPASLGRSIHLLQTRIILKDPKYFNDPKSPIKINVIHSMQPSLFKSIEDSLKSIARVVVGYKQAQQKGAQAVKAWFEQTDIANAVNAEQENLSSLLASKKAADNERALDIFYYFAVMGIDVQNSKKIAERFKNSPLAGIKARTEDILALP